ncbi:MAG: Stp1/IreP family PP2C-type Ser/Thr phosphatase [Actinobacteria bacterium]|nr:Stp1/IreP family PP2C-type Ser/Thr phosphatase [Actinomycetota bacterium]
MRLGRAAVVTDTGRRRLGNEDAYVWGPPLFAIADGMGGARAGEIAAGIAAATFEEVLGRTMGADAISEVIADANRRIWERSLADPATAGMGTTVTVALVDEDGETVVFGHVGDSRAYRMRDSVLEQITTDHSLVAELVESGVLTPEEAERHPQRSAITRALGTEPAVEPDVFTVDVVPGDLFLLCSDGLSDMLTEEQIAAAIERAGGEPEAAGNELVKEANARGGDDNITVLLFEIVAGEPDPERTAALEDTARATSPDGPSKNAGDPSASPEPRPDEGLRRHGAGPGGRIAAIVLLVAILIVAALVLYWGITS